ncbi:MAG: peptidoglycan editing factor PgeF [Pseudomonadota bacterium]
MDLILPDWIGAPPGVGACSTTRTGGFSTAPFDDGSGSGKHGLNLGANVDDDAQNLARNRQQLQAHLPGAPVWLLQVHGSVVVDAAAVVTGAAIQSQAHLCEADASFTDKPGVVCVVTTADCLPVLFTDMRGSIVAAVHAGWRGLAAGILQSTVAAMRARSVQNAGDSGELLAWLGPAIGPQHFEVGADVHAAMMCHDPRADAAFRAIPGKPDKYLADIYHLARLILANCGIRRIAGGQFSTFGDAARFYSYRRDGKTGRMATMIWIK